MTGNPLGPKVRGGPMQDLARYSGLGLQFAATVGVFALAGHWLDGRAGTRPWLLIAGVFGGFALGLYSMIKKVPISGGRMRPRNRPPDTP